MTDNPIIVMTSDKYLYALKPFAHLFMKYWAYWQEVTVLCFAKPDFELPANFNVVSMGRQDNYPVDKWSNAILEYLTVHNEIDRFVLMLEDYWLTRKVDSEAVSLLFDYSRANPNVIKVDLCGDRLYAAGMTSYGAHDRLDLIKSDYTSQYHMSLMAGIWNRELFLKYVYRDQSPWDVELFGTTVLAEAKDDVLVIGTRQWPVRYILALRNGNANNLIFDGMSDADKQELIELGLLNKPE